MFIRELKIFKSRTSDPESYLILIRDLDSDNTCIEGPLGEYHFSINKEKELTVFVHLNTRDKTYERMLRRTRNDITDSWFNNRLIEHVMGFWFPNLEMILGCGEFLKKDHKCNHCRAAYDSGFDTLMCRWLGSTEEGSTHEKEFFVR